MPPEIPPAGSDAGRNIFQHFMPALLMNLSWIFWCVSTSKSDFPDVFHDLTQIFLSKSYFLGGVIKPLWCLLTILTRFYTPSDPKLLFDKWLWRSKRRRKQFKKFLKIFLQKSAIKATATTKLLCWEVYSWFSSQLRYEFNNWLLFLSRGFMGCPDSFSSTYSQVHQGNTLHRVLPGQLSNILPLPKPTAVVI